MSYYERLKMNKLNAGIGKYIEKHPLASLMIIAIIFRAFAVIFAKGFGMHDDHFCVIEIAQKWLDGSKDWLGKGANLRSLFYPGLHFLLFSGLERIGIFDPQVKMYIVRALHAAFSLLTIFFGYKTVRMTSNAKDAWLAGLLLAVLWPMPFMSVRNLIEFVCIPPLMAGFYFIYKQDNSRRNYIVFLSGICFAFAFAIRFQTLVMAGTLVIILFASKKIKTATVFCAAFLISAFLFVGIPDWIWHGVPFSSLWYYVTFNSSHGDAYTTGPFILYLGLVAGVLIPPTSLLLLYGVCRTWKKYALMFWPMLVFFLLHSIFPNKQERFIMPVIPVIIMLAVMGWNDFAASSSFWKNHKKLYSGLWCWFWVFNSLLLILATFTYSKKSRVETLSYLYNTSDVKGIIVETKDATAPMMPMFYLGHKKIPVYNMTSRMTVDSLKSTITNGPLPNYVIFLTQKNLDARVEKMDSVITKIRYVNTVKPSIADQLLYVLNPKHNVNQTSYIYKSK
jgi:hypothetical protein